ncbi:MAG: DNA adenine methylase [archaeon]
MLKEKLKAAPFLKWAGGKRQLLEQFEDKYPVKLKENNIKTYIEPFVGGGALFFDLTQKYNFNNIILNDINKELIITYKVVKNEVETLISGLKKLEKKYLPLDLENRKEIYYGIRDKFNKEKKEINYDLIDNKTIEHAKHFIFLNRTCFNGLFRQNKKGEFNVPIGRYKNPTICDEEKLRGASELLDEAILISGDFTNTEKYITNNTFIYMDPPYRPLPGTSSFNKYSKADFNEESQKRLAKWYKTLNEKYKSTKNIYLMLSNSNPKNTDPEDSFFEDLYGEFNIEEVYAKRSINSKGSGRGKITELVITNY